jgi:hypothetical protein
MATQQPISHFAEASHDAKGGHACHEECLPVGDAPADGHRSTPAPPPHSVPFGLAVDHLLERQPSSSMAPGACIVPSHLLSLTMQLCPIELSPFDLECWHRLPLEIPPSDMLPSGTVRANKLLQQLLRPQPLQRRMHSRRAILSRLWAREVGSEGKVRHAHLAWPTT